MRIVAAMVMFVGLAGWVWVDAIASGAVQSPIQLSVDITLPRISR